MTNRAPRGAPVARRSGMLLALLVTSAVPSARADELIPAAIGTRKVPQWELGLGVTALSLPDYRGSDRSRAYALPIPYATFRTERFSADRGGLKADIAQGGRFELDLSLSASVPVRSAGNPIREGMPGLRPTLELGPQLLANLWRSADGNQRLQAQLPLRYVFAVSGQAHDAGLTFNPRLMLDMQHFAGWRGWSVALIGGPMYATRRHHAYYYSVDPVYARADRPAYQAAGGFGGYQLTLGVSRRFARHWLGGFVRFDRVSGAVFDDSPMVRQRSNVAAGIAFSWIFARSDRQVTLAR